MGVDITNTFGEDVTPGTQSFAISSEPDTILPEGNQNFQTAKGVKVVEKLGQDATGGIVNRGMGYQSYGRVSKAQKYIPGRIQLVIDGYVAAEKSPSRAGYQITGVPLGVFKGENYPVGNRYMKYQTEQGGAASKDLSGTKTRADIYFGEIDVTVNDVDGNPVEKDKVVIENELFETDSNGNVAIATAGNVSIEACQRTVSKTINVPSGQTKSTTFTYSGISGRVRTPGGAGIANTVVTLTLAGSDSVIRQTKTDESGKFSFPTTPVGVDADILADPFERTFTTAVQGKGLTKNLPFDTKNIGAIEIVLEDEISGEPISTLPASLASSVFSALTTGEGECALITNLEDGKKKEEKLVFGEDDPRYKTTTATLTVIGGESVELKTTLNRPTAVTNA